MSSGYKGRKAAVPLCAKSQIASAKSKHPSPPAPCGFASTAATPRAAQPSSNVFTSSAVSVAKRLSATTAGTPKRPTFSTCPKRLAMPLSSAATSSWASESLAAPPFILSASDRSHHGHRIGRQPSQAALDVEEFLGSQIGAEARFGDHDVAQPHAGAGRDQRVATVRDVGERPAVDESRRPAQRLHEVGMDGVLEKDGHRNVGADVAAPHGFAVAGVPHDDGAQALLEIGQVARQAENRHYFRRRRDHEAVLAGDAAEGAAQSDHDVAQRPVVHVHGPAPSDAPVIQFSGVGPEQMVVQHGGQERVSRRDRVEVAREVKIDVLHGHDLRIAAPCGSPLDAEDGSQGRFADAQQRVAASERQRVGEPYGRGGLAFAGSGGADARDQDQLGVAAGPSVHHVERHLGLEAAEKLNLVLRETGARGDLGNGLDVVSLSNGDVGKHGTLFGAALGALRLARWAESAVEAQGARTSRGTGSLNRILGPRDGRTQGRAPHSWTSWAFAPVSAASSFARDAVAFGRHLDQVSGRFPTNAWNNMAQKRISYYVVDAFTDVPFRGNPAAVCMDADDLADAAMQMLACEMNLSETAFLYGLGGDGSRRLRWFTPTVEVSLCGHATLASAHVLIREKGVAGPVAFRSASGVLNVRESAGQLVVDLPSNPPVDAPMPPELPPALRLASSRGEHPSKLSGPAPSSPTFAISNKVALVVLPTEDDVLRIRPDFSALRRIALPNGVMGVAVTAPAADSAVDFVSRFFGPWVGVDEDPVTGGGPHDSWAVLGRCSRQGRIVGPATVRPRR